MHISTEFNAHFPISRKELYSRITALYERLRLVGVFPALDMIYVSDDLNLVIVPNRGFHTDPIAFLRECFEMFAINSRVEKMEKNSEYFIDFAYFSDFEVKEIAINIKIIQANIGSECYFLHPLRYDNGDFSMLLAAYRSRLSAVLDSADTLVGWTRNPNSPISDLNYICERAKSDLWTCTNPFQESYELLLLLEEMHNSGHCHLFISFATIRKDPQTRHLTLVLPCIDLVYAQLMDSFLGDQWSDYQAAEVKEYLSSGKPIEHPHLADIYSVCKVISSVIRDSEDAGLRDLLRRGMSSNPQLRPQLSNLKKAFRP